ncbi:MAG: MoaD/ThiS family protein [Bacillaceae bacterium]|nr:MoaD/ThiS family protein [Bacillaceae bacterium]
MEIHLSEKYARKVQAARLELQLSGPLNIRELASVLCSLYPGLNACRGELEHTIYENGRRLHRSDWVNNQSTLTIGDHHADFQFISKEDENHGKID